MTFLDECRASRAAAGVNPDESQLKVLREWLSSRPEVLFEQLREHAPTLVLGRVALVTRFSDVRDVLRMHDVFSVEPYGDAIRRINRGPNFLLGLDDGPEHRQQLSLLSRIFRQDDAERIAGIVASRTSAALESARAGGRLDLTDDFGRLVPTGCVADYFGVPGPDPAALMKWARDIFTGGFANPLGVPLLSRRAMKAGDAFRAHLDALVTRARAEHGGGGAVQDTLLARLVAIQAGGEPGLSDARIRDTLLWCVAGMIDNINTAVCSVMDCLLTNATALRGAAAAAGAGDRSRLRAHVLEALRFHTPTPVATRLSVRTHTFSTGTRHETTIPAGTLTFAGLGAAMMDGTTIEAPREFRLDRPDEQYLHFGAGLHQCLGIHVAMAHLTHMVGSLLTLPGLRRARGITGRLRVVGAFPKTFVVEFDPIDVRRTARATPTPPPASRG